MNETVVFEALFPDTIVPKRATEQSAGFDLHMYLKGRQVKVRRQGGVVTVRDVPADGSLPLVLQLGDTALIPLGFKARLPAGFEAQIRMRSSWAFSKGLMLPNAPGTIDADYPDEWMVMVRSLAEGSVQLAHGERVAQAILARCYPLEWTPGSVGQSSDRQGGLGSTG